MKYEILVQLVWSFNYKRFSANSPKDTIYFDDWYFYYVNKLDKQWIFAIDV